MALKTDLIALWEMNEASGNRSDSFGSNTLIDNNTVTSEAGKFSQNAAVFVSANSEFLSIVDNAVLSFGDQNFAIAAWIKPSASAAGNIVAKWNHSANLREYRLGFKFGAVDRPYMEVSQDGSAAGKVEASTFGALSTAGDTWYWVYCEHDAGSDLLRISVNNGTLDQTAYASGCTDRASALNIGRLSSGIQYFDGSVQQVAIWGGLKSSGERAEIYNSGTGLSYSAWDADFTPPTVSSVAIPSAGTTVVITYDENVTATDETGFNLDSDGGAITLSSLSGDGTGTHTYTLSRTILSAETLNLDYDSGSGTAVDDAANALASFTDTAVVNNSTVTDSTPPELSSATINSSGTTLTLVFTENVTGQTAFAVDSDYGNLQLSAPSGDGTGTHVHTFSRPVLSTETVTLDYDSGPGTSVDDAANALASITNEAVTNNSTMAEPPSGYRGGWKPCPGLSSITPVITIARQNLDITGATTDGTGLIVTSTGSFAGIAWRPSDTVWISGGTGVTPGYYEVNTAGTNNDNQVTLLDSPGASATGVILKYGAWPIAVMVHAGGTSMSGYTGTEFDELEFSWDFGDSGDTRTYTVRNVDSGVNEEISYNDGQYGPMGCYTYIEPGDYMITLNVRGWNGSAYITASTTATIKVDDWPRGATNRIWFDGASGSDSNDGLDSNGFSLTGAAYNNTTGALTFTGNAATAAFTAAGFSNFEQSDQCPDWVYLASGTGGSFTATLAKILAKVDSNEFTLESGLFSGNVTGISTSNGPKQTYGAAVTSVNSTSNRRCMLKRGSTYNTTTSWAGQDGCGVADYGSGDKPVVNATANIASFAPSGSRNVILCRNIEFTSGASVTAGTVKFTGATQGSSDVLLYGVEFSGEVGSLTVNFGAAGGYEINRPCLWEIHKDTSVTAGVSGMIFIEYGSWMAIMGGYFSGGFVDPPNNLTHQVYPSCKETDGTAVIGLVRGMKFGSSDEVNFGLNWNINNNTDNTNDVRSNYGLIEGCNFQHGQGGLEISNSGFVGNNGQRTRSNDVVIENCCFHAGDGTAALGCVMLTCQRITLRDSRFWYGNTMNALYGTMSNHEFHIYRNKSYVVDGSTLDLDMSATVAGCEFAKNEMWMSVVEATADYLVGYYVDSVDKWSVVANQFYAPAASTGAYRDKTSAVAAALATYNGVVDGDDTEAAFDWSDPVNGVFQSVVPDTTDPEVISVVVNSAGTQVTVTFSEPVTGQSGFTMTASGGAVTLTPVSGDGTAVHVYSLSRVIDKTEDLTFDYSGTDIVDDAGNELQAFSGRSVIHNGATSVPGAVYRFAALRNTLRLRSQNCDDPRLTEAQRLECRRRQRSISRNG